MTMSEHQNLCIALLEDNVQEADLLKGWIENEGHRCNVFHDAENFQLAFIRDRYDIVILDWMLQTSRSGLDVLHWVRNMIASDIPVIFVTVRQAEEDIVTALLAGSDEYLVKPVRQHELLARLHALARRTQPKSQVLECSPFVFTMANREVKLHGEVVDLTEKEYELALFLFHNRGRVLSRQHLLISIWGTSSELSTRTIDTHVSRLRKKLKLHVSERWKLISIYKIGYRLEERTVSPRLI